MTFNDLRRTLPALLIITAACVVLGATLFGFVHDNAAQMNAKTYELLLMAIPAALMLLGSFFVMFFGDVNKTVFVTVVFTCIVIGLVGLGVTSMWLNDPAFTAPILANSPEGTELSSPIATPFKVFRDFALFAFTPMIGLIAGAWVGSRIGFTSK
ncbi:MAG: hypothetical protein Q4D06_06230 [Coriobacteriia bacterium]|nr:hypothetical protein [Coriobacteriia bacterium]